jgi:general secretion pathway protein M
MAVMDEARNYWERLSGRDRNLLMLMGGAIGVFLVFVTGMSMSHALDRRQALLETKTKNLREVAQLTVGYRQAESARTELERKLKDHAVKNLFSYIEELTKKDLIDIGGMTDKGTGPVGDGKDKDSKLAMQSVEVTLTRVPLDKLTKFLNDVENNPGMVRVTRLQIRPREDGDVLDAWFTVSTYYLGS